MSSNGTVRRWGIHALRTNNYGILEQKAVPVVLGTPLPCGTALGFEVGRMRCSGTPILGDGSITAVVLKCVEWDFAYQKVHYSILDLHDECNSIR
jgi:hypothetical protein